MLPMSSEIDFLKKLAANSQDCIFAYRLETSSLVFISKNVKEITGFTQAELEKHPGKILSLVHNDDRDYVQEQIHAVVAGQTSLQLEFRLLLNQNKIVWLYVKGSKVDVQEGQSLFVGFVENITKWKEREQNLYNVKEQKNTILQILGHDLRGPLNTIQMSTSLLEREQNLTTAGGKRLLEIINRTCRNSLRLISEMLEVEFLEMESVELTKSRTELVSHLQNQIETYLIGDNTKQFELSSNKATIYAMVDVTRFMLIMENIISNAYKFTQPDGRISIYIEEKEKTVLLTVADDGIGIPDDYKPIVFDKFTRARRKGVNGARPIGLGMHLIKKMMDMHEGKIWFESEEGKGTTFYVEIPR